jgi:CRAL/TRIO domain
MPIDDSHQRQIEETPDLVRDSLEQFQVQLDADVKKGDTTTPTTSTIFEEAARENATEYANPDFRLMFLRTDLFDVTLAVKRFRNYWQNRKRLFGQLHTLTVDPATLDRGYARLVQHHDRLVMIDPTRVMDHYEIEDVVRSIFFVLSQAIGNSVEAQKRGLVYLIDCEHALALKYFDRPLIRASASVFNDGFPVRVTAVVVLNLHPVGQWFISAFKLLMKPVVRQRIRVVKNHHPGDDDAKDKLELYAGLNRSELKSNLGYEPWKGSSQ